MKNLIKDLIRNWWLIVLLISWIVSLHRGNLSVSETFTTGLLLCIFLELRDINKKLDKNSK